jgi:two-component sensor histidine kinase
VNDAFLAEENSLLNGVVKILENSIASKIAEDNIRDFYENRENPIQKDVPGQISAGGNLQRTGMEEDLRKSREQKEVLLREVQQRVKNNLRAVHDLLALQQKYIRDEKVLKTLHESQNRIRAMALVHEILYQTPEITNIDLALYVNTLGKNLFDFYKIKGSRITLRTDIPGICIGVNSAIPIGLIMNELISNALKHAFPGNSSGEIFIRVRKKDRSISLLVRDTGAGMPRDLNWRDLKSLGLRMVFSLVEQMNGTIGLDRSRGTEFSMVLEERK